MISIRGLIVVLVATSLAGVARADLTITQQIQKERRRRPSSRLTHRRRRGSVRDRQNPRVERKTISGHAREEFETAANGMRVHLWLTRDLPNPEKFMSELSMLADAIPSGDSRQHLSGFLIRAVANATGLGKTTITVVAVSESPLADSEFVVPQGYRAMQAPAPRSK